MVTCFLQQSELPSMKNCQSSLFNESPSDFVSCKKRKLNTSDHCAVEVNTNATNDDIRKTDKSNITDNDVRNQQEKQRKLFRLGHESMLSIDSGQNSLKIKVYIKDEFGVESYSKATSISSKKQEKNMLFCQLTSTDNHQDQSNADDSSIYITSRQCATFIENQNIQQQQNLLIIDCGSTLRHSERHIKGSFMLNANDRLSLKRLSTRGFKNFFNANQVERLEKSDIVILYDDKINPTQCSMSATLRNSPAMKCIYDQIKAFDNTKMIYILQCQFDTFFQQYPRLCSSTAVDQNMQSSYLPEIDQSVDVLNCEMSEIIPGLYLGNANDASDINCLKKNNITSVVNISKTIPCFFNEDPSFEYLPLACDDSGVQDILQHFESTFLWIYERLLKNQKILIHCQAGISRSPSFVIGFLMKYHSMTFEQAYQVVKMQRSIVNPNINFIGQLSQYQQMIKVN